MAEVDRLHQDLKEMRADRDQLAAQLREATTNVERGAGECVALRAWLTEERATYEVSCVDLDEDPEDNPQVARYQSLVALLSAPSSADAVLARVRQDEADKQAAADIESFIAALRGDAIVAPPLGLVEVIAQHDARVAAEAVGPLLARIRELEESVASLRIAIRSANANKLGFDKANGVLTARVAMLTSDTVREALEDALATEHNLHGQTKRSGLIAEALMNFKRGAAESAAFVAGVRRAAVESLVFAWEVDEATPVWAPREFLTLNGKRVADLECPATVADELNAALRSLAPAPTKTETK